MTFLTHLDAYYWLFTSVTGQTIITAQTAFHHCTFQVITAHFVHHCTLKQALTGPTEKLRTHGYYVLKVKQGPIRDPCTRAHGKLATPLVVIRPVNTKHKHHGPDSVVIGSCDQ